MVQQSVTASYRPEVKKLVNVSYKRTVDVNKNATTDQYEVSGQWPITRQWYGVARYNYDLISNRVLNRVAGLEYATTLSKYICHGNIRNLYAD